MFPLKLGYFQGPTVNLPEGNPCSKKKTHTLLLGWKFPLNQNAPLC
jgi:hypothetical protein